MLPFLLVVALLTPVVAPRLSMMVAWFPSMAAPLRGATERPAVLDAYERLIDADLWPCFEPAAIPVALHDGTRTWLLRHPRPPEGFARVDDDLAVFEGRHEVIRANTSTVLDGVALATLMAPPADRTLDEHAAVLVHEAFHVHQHAHHPGWGGDESVLFTYPDADVEALALRRLETEALRRALAARDAGARDGWALAALLARRDRFARLPAPAVAYERGGELSEGLASYVQDRALGGRLPLELPEHGYAPDALRLRVYDSGLALARLLDAVDPAWRDDFVTGTLALDEALALRLARGVPAAFGAEERATARARAERDVAALRDERAARLVALQQAPRLDLLFTGGAPMPAAFDPTNVTVLGEGAVHHRRWLVLRGDGLEIEVLDGEALTFGAGEHPLWNGVRRLVVPAGPGTLALERDGEAWRLAWPGGSARLGVARVPELVLVPGETLRLEL